MAYDIIGDIHGQDGKLTDLLAAMGYRRQDGAWRHAGRQAIFIGDLIDRGPGQVETMRIVRDMVETGAAQAVMGNHELNAIGYHARHPHRAGDHLRERSAKNRAQHSAFVEQVGEDSADHESWVGWFMTLPLWLDLGGIRVIHACWDARAIAVVEARLGGNRLTEEAIPDVFARGVHNSWSTTGDPPRGGTDLFHAIETLLKGIEVDLPAGCSFTDGKSGRRFTRARTRWWSDTAATFRNATLATEPLDDLLPDDPLPAAVVPGHDGGTPVIIGHYWMRGTPVPQTAKVACVDYSAGKDGPLVAYRWDGETELSAEKFIGSHR